MFAKSLMEFILQIKYFVVLNYLFLRTIHLKNINEEKQ